MTRGISEETLVALIRTDGYGNDYIDPDEALTACTELNPWLPIEDAPKDVPLLVECKGDGEKKYIRIGSWSGHSWTDDHGYSINDPVRWKHLQ